MKPLQGVFLSETLDLEDLFADVFQPYRDVVQFKSPAQITDPSEIEIALAWYPSDDAFKAYPNIRIVSSIAAGVDNIIKCPSLPETIQIIRVRDPEQAQHMAEFALWHVIGAHRDMRLYACQQRDRIWQKHPYKPASTTKVVVFGYGLMGATTAKLAARVGFDTYVFAQETPDEPVEGITFVLASEGKEPAVENADVLINLLPATADTIGILDASVFDRMKSGSMLVNLGRGNHLCEPDLLKALETGQLAGAALDVAMEEPLSESHPFWGHEKITLTPHVAAESTFESVAKLLSEDLHRISEGLAPIGHVDRKLGF